MIVMVRKENSKYLSYEDFNHNLLVNNFFLGLRKNTTSSWGNSKLFAVVLIDLLLIRTYGIIASGQFMEIQTQTCHF